MLRLLRQFMQVEAVITFFNNIKIVVNIESQKTMKLQTESIPNTLNAPKEQEKALRLGS